MAIEEFAKIQKKVDKLCDELHGITSEDMIENTKEWLKNIKPRYPHRKWNWKKRQREKVYKDYPPKNPYYEWKG